jgi:uncharacterized small protein (DUF1192 family)
VIVMFEEEMHRRPGPVGSGPGGFAPAALADWSEDTLKAYVEALKAEIARAEAAIAARAAQRVAADAFFRKP